MSTQPEFGVPKQINVLSQNVLLDYTRTRKGDMLQQVNRIHAVADTFAAFPGQLDVVGIQEAQKIDSGYLGEALSSSLDCGPGFWTDHNEKPYPKSPTGRGGESIGLFGVEVDNARPLELGDHRRAVLTEIAGVAFVTMHLRAGASRAARAKRGSQADALVEQLEDYENAVVFGDWNEPYVPVLAQARRRMRRAGYTSVFDLTHQPHPKTWPTDEYRELMYQDNEWLLTLLQRGWSFDDILVRGPRVKVLAAGVLEPMQIRTGLSQGTSDTMPRKASDHRGVWGTLEIV